MFKEEYERMLSARGPEAVSKYNSFAKNHFRCLSGKDVQAPVVALHVQNIPSLSLQCIFKTHVISLTGCVFHW